MLNLRVKVALTAALFIAAATAYFRWYWIPLAERSATATIVAVTEAHLDSLSDAVLPYLLQNQLATIYELLDSARQRNPHWLQLQLTDTDDQLIYPLMASPPLPIDSIRYFHHTIQFHDKSLGELRLQVDISGRLADLLAGYRQHGLMMLLGAIGFVITLVVLLELLVTRPVQRLNEAARRLGDGDFTVALSPSYGSRELTALSHTFIEMRDRIHHHQQQLQKSHALTEQAHQTLFEENRLHRLFSELLSVDLQQRTLNVALGEALDMVLQGGLQERVSKAAILLLEPREQRLDVVVEHHFPELFMLRADASEWLQQAHDGWIEGEFRSLLLQHQTTPPARRGGGYYQLPIRLLAEPIGLVLLVLPEVEEPSEQELRFLRAAVLAMAFIVQQKRQEQTLLRARDLAEQTSRAKSTFLTNMSHELRTPMHAILGFSEIGRKKVAQLPEAAALGRYFDHIRASGERLLGLVNNLLDLSRLEAGQHQFNFRHNPLQPLVTLVIEELQPLMRDRRIGYRITESLSNSEVWCDIEAIRQVLENLIANALRFAPVDSELTIALSEQQLMTSIGSRVDAVAVTIDDCGAGVPEDELELIFEKFFQSSRTHDGSGGTGLGLAICAGIIAGHGGRIWAENRPQGGARFSFILPRQPQPVVTTQHHRAMDSVA